MNRPPDPLASIRQGYRYRRLGDAARLLPLLGAALFALPLLGGQGHSTSGAGIWLFAVWLGLVIGAAALSRPLGRRLGETAADPTGPDGFSGSGRDLP